MDISTQSAWGMAKSWYWHCTRVRMGQTMVKQSMFGKDAEIFRIIVGFPGLEGDQPFLPFHCIRHLRSA